MEEPFDALPGDGVNGMAGDDMIMTIVFIGTWVATVAITVLEGFYIELNQVQFGGDGTLAANDANFAAAHPMTGIFLMIVLSLALLLVDFYGVTGRARRITAAISAIGLIAAAAGTTLWTFVDPATNGLVFALLIGGIAISYLAVLVAATAVRSVQTRGFDRTTP
jgi:cytochrome c oxidase subunit IV